MVYGGQWAYVHPTKSYYMGYLVKVVKCNVEHFVILIEIEWNPN